MKKNILYLLASLMFSSCNPQTGLRMQSKSTIEIVSSDNDETKILKAAHVVPNENQLTALKDEFIAFIHFGPNTFSRMEWGSGFEDPKSFDLQNLDTDQWCKAIDAAGMKRVIITAKHHDGFCLWPSRYTEQSVASSPFKNGKGDILKELSESCKKYGLKLGVYLSPADLFQIENKEGLYGNLSKYTERTIPREIEGRPFENKTTFTFNVDDYNEYFLNQLFELLTEYGQIDEVWFDGAHPKRKGGQKYNYAAWKELIHTLAPKAVIFGKEDIRWCGNESGKTRDTEWNVIPYGEDPSTMERFADLRNESLGSRTDLLKGKFLHYQPAETNTSIREGWFYRDEEDQKVRSVDDVFDMYERSVGGNSIFLLNIPPNREGKFSPEDVSVLEEVGKRIKETYATDLFSGGAGSKAVLDNNDQSFELMESGKSSLEINTSDPVTINRFVIKEAIRTHSERVEEHMVYAWVEGGWQTIDKGTNIGYQRILRFPDVTSNRFKFEVLSSRSLPAIAEISGHFYASKPPQLEVSRDVKGLVTIETKKHNFGWKPHGEDAVNNINNGLQIRFTSDGSTPNYASSLYQAPFSFASGEVKARSFIKEVQGSVAEKIFGLIKADWKLMGSSGDLKSKEGKYMASNAIDENPSTYWKSNDKTTNHNIEIDLGAVKELTGFAYTPQVENGEGMIEKGLISYSQDGRTWTVGEAFEFGNLINDPSQRRHFFSKSINTRYVKIESTSIAGGWKTAAIAEIDFFN